jgi:4-amino-4-deoxy-L-arabinose transferase-like glycosyltransferase
VSRVAGDVAAVGLCAAFVVIVIPFLDTLWWDYDEGWFLLYGRLVRTGLRPFVDFAHHQPALHLYLLAASGALFGDTVFGYRMLSLVCVVASGLGLYWFVRLLTGSLAALLALALFLFSPAQVHALGAVPETPMALFTLLGVGLLFGGATRASTYVAGVAFVIALLIKPTCLVVVIAAVVSLVVTGSWGRAVRLAVAGLLAATVGLAWTFVSSDGVFWETLRLQMVERIATRRVSIWTVDTGLADIRRFLGMETPLQWAFYSFRQFCMLPQTYLPMAVVLISLVGIPTWWILCARRRPALGVFAIFWPVSGVLLNFVALDFVSAKYFIPWLVAAGFLIAGLLHVVQRRLPPLVAGAATAVACAVLAVHFVATISRYTLRPYHQRAIEIAAAHPKVVSFSPMFFMVTGAEPACEFTNPALTFGSIGDTFLRTERTRRFHFSDERLVACLRADPEVVVVLDPWFYVFTRPGSALRAYLREEETQQAVVFDPRELETLARAFDLR